MTRNDTGNSALSGLRVLNLYPNLGGAFVGQFFADHGAEVVLVEPSGGSALRGQAGWPVWARGSKSMEATLDDPAVRALALRADVLIDTFRPGVLERHGLGHEQLAAENPRLVTTSISAFGRTGPYARLKGYEGVVMAKIGAYSQFASMVTREGPGFPSAPYCTVSAALVAISGALVALYDREESGVGQRVDAPMVAALGAHDTWNWMTTFWARKYPESYKAVPSIDKTRRVPNTWLMFSLLQALTKDGVWLQFSQASPKQFQAFLKVAGLNDTKWKDAWEDDDLDRREAFWETLLGAVRAKTLEEWQRIFDENTDVFAEIFRTPLQLLEHPQMLYDKGVVDTSIAGLGEVRMPGPFVRLAKTPASGLRPVPALNEHAEELRKLAEAPASPAVATRQPEAGLPLAGVTILELGGFFAAPFGVTVLTDLGARVLKMEPLEGDTMRYQLPFPEMGGVKVTQGKESVAVDLGKPEGIEIVKRLLPRVDMVLQGFRAGVAKRLGLDEAAVRAVNPNIIYHEAPGFGTGGPFGHRPAYAPTISAGSGLALRNIGAAVPSGPDLTLEQVKGGSLRMLAAAMTVAHPDGFSALGVTCGQMVGLLARKRGLGAQGLVTTMLSTMAQVLSEDAVDYAGRPAAPTVDPDLLGFGPLYRLYQAQEGWVFLAAPQEQEWSALVAALPDAGLDAPEFATAAGRAKAADALADRLARTFRARPAAEWEKLLTAKDIACVEVDPGPSHDTFLRPGGLADQLGMSVTVEHPIFGEYPRQSALMSFSRSATQALPGVLVGQHTESVLREFGYGEAEIGELAERGVIGLG